MCRMGCVCGVAGVEQCDFGDVRGGAVDGFGLLVLGPIRAVAGSREVALVWEGVASGRAGRCRNIEQENLHVG